MTTTRAPICLMCKHYRPDADGFTCAAFPKGIPEKILTSAVDHRKPVDGDGGVQFVAKSRQGTAYAVMVFGK